MKKKTTISILLSQIIVFLLCPFLASCEPVTIGQTHQSNTTIYPDSYIPSDLDDAIHYLKSTLSKRRLNLIKNGDESDLVKLHHGLGRNIRNEWKLWSDSRLAHWFNELGIYHPDDMSAIIIKSLYRDLVGLPIDLEEQVAYYKEYWAEVKAHEENERHEDILRQARREKASLNWKWLNNDAVEVTLPKQPEGQEIWGLYPYSEGVIVVVKGYRRSFERQWHDGIYYLEDADASLEPLVVGGCDRVDDVVVRENVATWLCQNSDANAKGWKIVETSPGMPSKTYDLNLETDHDWLRLGLGKSNPIIIAPDRIYRPRGTQWMVTYQAPSLTRQYPKFDSDGSDREDEYFFPQRSATPIEHGDFLYFLAEDDGNSGELYRFQHISSTKDLEDAQIFLGYRFIGNWVFYVSDITIDNENHLWIANYNLGDSGGSIYRVNNHHEVHMASLRNNVIFNKKLEDIRMPVDWKRRVPVGAISFKDGNMFLAGTDGIVRVSDGLIEPIVYFTYPKGMSRMPYTSRPQYDYHITPQRLAILNDGSFIIGDSYSGVYIIKKRGASYSIHFPELSRQSRNILDTHN